ncbi:Golgi pH regulator B [Blyttiomyces sp. JEL0837]|nr:Golgi pH regulator B [Blyttiomyces sp. JEL0837]
MYFFYTLKSNDNSQQSKKHPPSTTASISFTTHLIHESLARVITIGVTLMALLSGFAAINTPYTMLFYFNKGVTDTDVRSAERAVERMEEALLEKRRRLMDLTEKKRASAGDDGGSVSGFMKRVYRSVKDGLKGSDEIAQLRAEIQGTEALFQQMTTDLENLHVERAILNILFLRRMLSTGHNKKSNSMTVSIISQLLKPILNRATATGTDSIATVDTTTATAAISAIITATVTDTISSMATVTSSESLLDGDESSSSADASLASHATTLSFILIGGMVASSIRGMFIQVARMLRRIRRGNPALTSSSSASSVSSSRGGNSGVGMDTVMLFCAQMMGMYLLTLVVLVVGRDLPKSPVLAGNVAIASDGGGVGGSSVGDASGNVIGGSSVRGMLDEMINAEGGYGIQLEYFDRWFDVIFLVAAVTSAAVVWSVVRGGGADSDGGKFGADAYGFEKGRRGDDDNLNDLMLGGPTSRAKHREGLLGRSALD